MWVEVNLRIGKGRGKFSDAFGGAAFGQLVGKKLGVIVGEIHMQEESISINGMPYR